MTYKFWIIFKFLKRFPICDNRVDAVRNICDEFSTVSEGKTVELIYDKFG